MSKENDPLLLKPQHTRTPSSGYYFINKSDPSYQGVGTTSAVNDTDSGPVIEGPPIDSDPSEFAPRLLHKSNNNNNNNTINRSNVNNNNNITSFHKKPWWDVFNTTKPNVTMATTSQRDVMNYNTSNNPNKRLLNKTRKAPVKIEPKVFFSNERTFIAWMHVSIILAGGSIAILAFADSNHSNGNSNNNPFSQLYGIILLPVAISFIIYSMYQYQRRSKMIRTRHPGPYEDTIGPTVLGIMLMVSITAQFALKLYSMHYM